jgi:hypothetical protein
LLQLLLPTAKHAPRPPQVTMQMAAIIPVILNSDICHQSIHPLVPYLKPYTRRRMNGVVRRPGLRSCCPCRAGPPAYAFITHCGQAAPARVVNPECRAPRATLPARPRPRPRQVGAALALCNSLYLAIAVCTCLVFGPRLEPDVLNNMSATEMEPLVGSLAAHLISDTVRVGFAVALVGSFVLLMYPMRQTLAEVFCSGPGGRAAGEVPAAVFYPLTYALVAGVYATAVFVPSIWAALSIVGSTASTLQGFLFPALLVLALEPGAKARHWARKGVALLVAALGVGLFVNGFLLLLWPGEKRSEDGRANLWALW